jgi:hypothetical protein
MSARNEGWACGKDAAGLIPPPPLVVEAASHRERSNVRSPVTSYLVRYCTPRMTPLQIAVLTATDATYETIAIQFTRTTGSVARILMGEGS